MGLGQFGRDGEPQPRAAALGGRLEGGENPVAHQFDAAAVRAAIGAAQSLTPGYTYLGFCNKIAAAGCTGYLVSLPGRRVVYVGRTGETHVERMPD